MDATARIIAHMDFSKKLFLMYFSNPYVVANSSVKRNNLANLI